MKHFSIVLGGRYKVFGSGTGPIFLTNAHWTSNELSLLECSQLFCDSCQHCI